MNSILLLLAAFAGLMAAGFPVYLSMLIPSAAYILVNPNIATITVVQKMFTGVNSFPLMAVPFFILAGNLMNKGSVTTRIFRFAKGLVGHFRGGLGYVNILASVIFAGMSGTALADVGGLGAIEIKAMDEAGYPEDFTIGITAASGTIGPIIPPSVPFVVYASYASVSTGALFMAGIVPGVLMALALAVMCWYLSRKNNYPCEPKCTPKQVLYLFKESLLALFMPMIIIGGIWSGWFTATEAAMAAIAYACVISVFVYRDIKVRELPKIFLDSIKTVLPVLAVIIAATVFCYILTYEKLDTYVLQALTAVTDNRYVVMALICVFVFLMGMVFESTVTVLLLVPILSTLCGQYGFSMVHLGVVITLGNMIGLITPPVGMSLFVMSATLDKPVMKIAGYCKIWYFPLLISWLLIAFVEPLCMFIPNLLGIG